MDSERARKKLGERTAKWIDALVDKLLHEEDNDDPERGFIGDIVDIIKLKMPKKQKKNAPESETSEDVK